MIACDSYLSLFFFTLQKKLRSGAIVRFSDNSSFSKGAEFRKLFSIFLMSAINNNINHLIILFIARVVYKSRTL